MRIRALFLFLFMFSLGCTSATNHQSSFTLYLVRHAEKQADGSRDPALSETGELRSRQLASWFQDKKLEDVWSSDYRRTRDTASPLLARTDLEITLYDPNELSALADALLQRQHNALVVGHSNTTPELAGLLCQCEISVMDESEYDRLIVVTVANGTTFVKTLTQGSLLPLADGPGL